MSLELITLLGAALSLLAVAAYRFFVQPYELFRRRGVGGPRAAVLFGSWWGRWSKVQGEEDLALVKQFGPVFGEFAGRTPVLVAVDPAVARAVLLDAADHFCSRRANCVRDKFLHQGLLALEARSPQGAPLSQDAIRQILPRILKCTNELSSAVKQQAESSEGKVAISGVVSDFLVKVLVQAVLGCDEAEKAIDVTQFSNYFSQAFINENPDSPLAAFSMIYPSLVPLDKFVLKPKAAKYFTSLLLCKVQEKTNAEKKDRQPDLMDLLLELHQVSKKKDSEEESKTEENVLETKEFVFVQSLAVLLNTSLTARSLMILGTVMLGANPELQERLHAKLYQKLEASDEFDLIHNSEYLDMFISEVLRLYPIEYRLERECCESLELENAKIEKGMIVTIPIYALHRQTQIYEEPEKFNPERFSHENKEARDSFAFLPYGQAGNNAANISVQWSVLVAKLAIAALIKKFRFSPADGAKLPPAFEPGVTVVPALGPQIVVAESRK